MKKIYFALLAITLLATSCKKELDGPGADSQTRSEVPADFDWKMTQNASLTVDVPTADGAVAPYALVAVYSSPVLLAENLVASGVTKPGASFRSAFTMPAGSRDVYVQVTLPDGAKSVKMIEARENAHVSGVAMKSVAASTPKIRFAQTRVESSMPQYPVMSLKSESDFNPSAVIREIQSGKNYQLGASWCFFPAAEYLIPAGVEIRSAIDLNGTFSPNPNPILYVAGKLTVSSLSIGTAQLVVLPGGEVTATSLYAQNTGSADRPAIYLFEGGKLTTSKPNLSCKSIVNSGELVIDNKFDLNNGVVLYNTATGKLTVADEFKISNKVTVYNDGALDVMDLKLNSDGVLYNCENAALNVSGEMVFERGNTTYQRGKATINEMTARGTMYVNCYTYAEEIDAQNATFNLTAGAALESKAAEFNNTDVSMGDGSMFITGQYNVKQNGGKNYFRTASSSPALRPVVIIMDKAYTRKGHESYFSGPMEIVYDNSKNENFVIREEYVTEEAVVRAEQTVIIPSTPCNGGKEPIDPDPVPEPTEEFELKAGQTYTYCFEDNWPWRGDYDMNDVVAVVNVNRMVSKDGGKVKSIAIDWETKAAGTTFKLAFAVQLDKIPASQVTSVTSTHTGFTSGIFAQQGLEQGQELAVIPFFNDTKEVLGSKNTSKGGPVAPTTKYTTTVEFAQPVDVDLVKESDLNFFIVTKERSNEIHMPTYKPTALGVVTGKGSPSDPYKFYDKGDLRKYNYMMWALCIPGQVRYPIESQDICVVYKYFMPWATSNGVEYPKWYEDEADETKLY